MNNRQTKTMEELKDSRIMFEKPMPRFGYMIVLTVALLLIAILVWSIYTPKVYMIKAAGTVTSENSNYIMPSYTGEIVDNFNYSGATISQHLSVLKDAGLVIDVKEGKYVFYELNTSVVEDAMKWLANITRKDDEHE